MVLTTWADIELADVDRMFRVNVRGTFVISQMAARTVRGHWINGQVVYCDGGIG